MSEMHAILLFRGKSSQRKGDLFEHSVPTSKHHFIMLNRLQMSRDISPRTG